MERIFWLGPFVLLLLVLLALVLRPPDVPAAALILLLDVLIANSITSLAKI